MASINTITITLTLRYGPRMASPLFASVQKGHVGATRLLLDGGADPDTTRHGLPVLYMSCIRSNISIVADLLEAEADPNIEDSEGRTPLCGAASQDDGGEAVRLLLRYKAAVDKTGRGGATPLHHTVSNANTEVARTLIEEGGANLDQISAEGVPVLLHAAGSGKQH